MLDRIIEWAKAQDSIRAVALVGSTARQDHPADEWSDLDLVLVAADPQAWLASTDWLAEIGEPWFTFVERDPAGQAIERRVLFAGGKDVDFIILPVESARQGFAGTFVPEIAARGLRVLLDKDGILPPMPVATFRGPVQPPSCEEFSEVVNDFWFHAVWTAKKLRRGELWVAKSCCDDYLKRLLLRMLAWQAQWRTPPSPESSFARSPSPLKGEGENDGNLDGLGCNASQPIQISDFYSVSEGSRVDTWFNGRFIEQWASLAALKKLRIAFAHYEEENVWKALQVSMELFHQVAGETAGCWRYEYPAEKVKKVMRWVEACQLDKWDADSRKTTAIR